jgi:hypothetical protein
MSHANISEFHTHCVVLLEERSQLRADGKPPYNKFKVTKKIIGFSYSVQFYISFFVDAHSTGSALCGHSQFSCSFCRNSCCLYTSTFNKLCIIL